MACLSAAIRHARPRQLWTRQTQDAYRNNAPGNANALAADSAERNQVPLDFTWAGDARNLKAMNPTVEANSARLLGTPEQAVEQSHAELRRQREWFRITLASIGDAVIATDADARVTFLNPAAEALTGWSSAEAIGQPVRLEIGSLASAARLAEGLPRWAFRVRDLAAEAESWEVTWGCVIG